MNIFNLIYPQFKNDKPIRLISLFSGYESQKLALDYLDVDVEHYRTCEWAINSIQALKDLHFTNDNTDYSKGKTYVEIIDFLENVGISADYSNPLTRKELQQRGENKLRKIYNNIIATNNMVNIMQVDSEKIGIRDTNKYTYLLTYSFPCQDLSLAGKRKGMEVSQAQGGTRSGLLWEVERILKECKELPQILVMENVPQVMNAKGFDKWRSFLEKLGYKNYYDILNAKDYGIPQNRKRCFMVSIFGDYAFNFPKKTPLKYRLKNLLETKVDVKYFVSCKMIEGMKKTSFESYKLENKLLDKNSIAACILSRFDASPQLIKSEYPILAGELSGSKWNNTFASQKRVYNPTGLSPTITTFAGGNTEIKVLVSEDNLVNSESTICLNSKIDGRQPSVQDRIYTVDGLSTAITTGFMPSIAIPENTKNGFAEAYEGDGVYISTPHQKRGVVQTGMIQTLKTSPDCGVVVKGNYSPSNHSSARIVDGEELAPTVMGNHGTVTAVLTDFGNKAINETLEKDNLTVSDLRLRKLTPKECFRLMGVKDEDFNKVSKSQSNSSLYHLAGDSIVTTCLMAIFGKIFNVSYISKIDRLLEEITSESRTVINQ